MGGPGRRGKTGREEREGCSSAEASLPAAIPSGCHRQAALSGWRTAAFAICIPSTQVGTSSATLLSVRSAAGAPRGAVHGRPTYRVLKDSMTLLMFAAFSTLGSTRACQGRENVTATRRGHADRHAGSRRKRRWCLGAPWGSLRRAGDAFHGAALFPSPSCPPDSPQPRRWPWRVRCSQPAARAGTTPTELRPASASPPVPPAAASPASEQALHGPPAQADLPFSPPGRAPPSPPSKTSSLSSPRG